MNSTNRPVSGSPASSALYSSLQRMAEQARQQSQDPKASTGASNIATGITPGNQSGGFSAVMKSMARQVNDVQADAGKKANDFSLGKPDADLAEAMIAMQRARVHFESMVQVRNKLVSAYQEVMRMPV